MTTLTTGAGRLLRGLAATTVTTLMLAGIPYALVQFIGWPLPDHIPASTGELSDWLTRAADDQFILNALAVGLWLAWARFAYWFLVAVIDAVRQGPRHLSEIDWRSAPIKGVAAVLVGSIVGALLFDLARGMVIGTPATAGPPTDRPTVSATTAEHAHTTVTAQTSRLPDRARPAEAAAMAAVEAHDTYTVCQGDSLWKIAGDKLGNPDEWRAIWVLNRHHTFADGRTFTQPDIIHPGWVLKLPTAVPAEGATPAPTIEQPPQSYLDRHDHDGNEVPAVTTPAAQLPGDGVATPRTPTSAPPIPSAQTPSAPTPSGATDTRDGVTAGNRIILPSGSWIGVTLAAALVLAGRMVWIQRRRLYKPKPPTAALRLNEPETAPLPAVVRHVQRGLTAAAPTTDTAVTVNRDHDATSAATGSVPDWSTADGADLDAAGQVRAALVQALAAGAHDFDERGYVIVPASTLAVLLPGTDPHILPNNPRLIVTADLSAALDWCEEQLLYRRRVLISHDVDDAYALRDSDPFAEPMPTITLITERPGDTEHIRAAAILAQGRRVNITAVILGLGPHGEAAGNPAPAGSLTAHEAVALLHTITEGHTGHRTAPLGDPAPDHEDAETGLASEPAAVDPTDDPESELTDPQREDLGAGDRDDTADSAPVRVRITVLGDVVIHNPDNRKVDPPIRRQSIELAAYLIGNGGTARQSAIKEDLLPDVATSRAPARLDTYVYSLRKGLAAIGGQQLYLDHPRYRYILNADAVDVDLWQMQAGIRRAETTSDRDERIAALREAISLYTGPFAGDLPYEWKDTYVAAVSMQALDARIALAEALQDHQPDEAIDILLQAIDQEPTAEEPYRQAMTLYARLGNANAIRDLRRTITRVHEEADIETSDDLIAHAERLLAQANRKRGRDSRGAAPSLRLPTRGDRQPQSRDSI